LTDTERGLPRGAGPGAQSGRRRRPSWAVLLPALVFGALALVFFVQLLRGGATGEIPSVLINRPAPEFELAALEGLVNANGPVPGFSTRSLIGEVSVVNVWASWCGPCRLEHPYVERLGEDGRFQLLGINHTDSPGNALRFLAELGNPYNAVGVDPRGRTSIDWGVYGVPETFLVDRRGVIRFKIIGPIDEARYRNELLPRIEALLAEPPPG
jgi:cytochrome c biogenesis protein CcmG, thiol:disulfide interchange protein DsbE